MMRETIRHNFLESTLSYEEKPREQWLFDYPAQVSLCGTQIWWTTEVNIAFARLEEGYENALKDYQRKQVNIDKSEDIYIIYTYRMIFLTYYVHFLSQFCDLGNELFS